MTFRAQQHGDRLLLELDPPPIVSTHPVTGETMNDWLPYLVEFRRGDSWLFAHRICTRTKRCRVWITDFCAGVTQKFHARTLGEQDGFYAGDPRTIEVTTVHPEDHTGSGLRDETTESGGWPGTKTGTQVSGTSLVLSPGESEGTYVSPEISLGALKKWRLGFQHEVSWSDASRNAGAFGLTAAAGLHFTAEDASAQQPAKATRPTALSLYAKENDAQGNIYDPPATILLEVRVYEVSGSPGDWQTGLSGEWFGKYLQFRLTVTRTDTTNQTISVDTMNMSYSYKPQGESDQYNVEDYGAVGDGVTDDTAAISAALAAAAADGYGGEVYMPKNAYLISSGLSVPNRVTLQGARGYATRLIADAGFSGSWMVRLGDGLGGDIFHCRVQGINFDANDVSGLGCVYSDQSNEQCGVFDCDFNNYRTWAVKFEGCSQCGVRALAGSPSTSGSLGGVNFTSVLGTCYIDYVSIVGASGHGDGIYVYGGNVNVSRVHVEGHTDGIHFDGSANGEISHAYGHSSLTNLVHLGASCASVAVADLTANGATNILVDDYRSVTYTGASTTSIRRYLRPEITGRLRVSERIGVGIEPEGPLHVWDSANSYGIVAAGTGGSEVWVSLQAAPAAGVKQRLNWNASQSFVLGSSTDHGGGSFTSRLTFDTGGGATFSDNVIVGGDLGINCTPSYALSVGSPTGADQVGIYHDDLSAFIKWTDGVLHLVTDEGTNTSTYVRIKGKGTGYGNLAIYDQDDAEYLNLRTFNGGGLVSVSGTSPVSLSLQKEADVPIEMFSIAASGETQEVKIYGYRTGDAKRSLEIGVGVDAANTASYDGVATHRFNGELYSTGDTVVGGQLDWTAASCLAFCYTGEYSPSVSQEAFFMDDGGMFWCIYKGGTLYKVELTAV